MSVVGGILLGALVALLFYRWVERRHKMAVAKIALGFLALALAVGLVMYSKSGQADRKYANALAGIGIIYQNDTASWSSPPGSRAMVRTNPFIVGAADHVDTAQFGICNRGSDTLLNLTFTPKTFVRGRSTAYDLIQPAESRTNTLESDYIVAPRKCVLLTWSDTPFVVRDSVLVTPVYATFSSNRR